MNIESLLKANPEFTNHFKNARNRTMTDSEVKDLSLLILDEVDSFCRQHGIKYSLAYGTLLGAIRHKGYIPWDDDIDILMLRQDYEKFISSFPNNTDTLYSVASYETDNDFHYPYAKVVCNATIFNELGYSRYGYGIDLFPIDMLPDNYDLAIRLLRKQRFLRNMMLVKSLKWKKGRGLAKNLLLIFLQSILLFVPYSFIQKLIRCDGNYHISSEGEYHLGCLFSPYFKREIMEKEIFDEFVLLPFERSQYYCIKEYDKYLTNIYGDYMQLPPVEKRCTHHAFVPWWK